MPHHNCCGARINCICLFSPLKTCILLLIRRVYPIAGNNKNINDNDSNNGRFTVNKSAYKLCRASGYPTINATQPVAKVCRPTVNCQLLAASHALLLLLPILLLLLLWLLIVSVVNVFNLKTFSCHLREVQRLDAVAISQT